MYVTIELQFTSNDNRVMKRERVVPLLVAPYL